MQRDRVRALNCISVPVNFRTFLRLYLRLVGTLFRSLTAA